MIVFYKNFKRTERTLLSIQSVRHFYPDMDIRCLNLFLENADEYKEYIEKFESLNVKLYFDKKTYNFESSAVGSGNNGYYFTEGMNKIFNIVHDVDDKVFILDEDQFFTTGETLKFLLETSFDLACSHWPAPPPLTYEQRPPHEINGAFVGVNPVKLANVFPLPEKYEYIEILLGHELYNKCVNQELNIVNIPTRNFNNYYGDGMHTNNIEEIKERLAAHNIPFEL